MLDGQLAGRDDALGLVSDVKQDLIVIDLDHGAFDDIAVIEVLDGLVDRGEEILSGADVIDGYLRDVGIGHMYWCSGVEIGSSRRTEVRVSHADPQHSG